MKKSAFFLILFIFVFLPVLRAEEVSLTLDEAVSIALRDNPNVLIGTEEVKKAKAKLAEAHSGLFPTVTISGGWSESRGFYPKDMSEISAQANLRYYLYQGGRVINAIKFSEYGIFVSEALLDKVKLDTVFAVQKAFYTLLLSSELSRLNEEILSNTGEHLRYLEARYASGQASESSILNIKSSLSSVEEAYVSSLNQTEASESVLKNLLHLDEKIKIKPAAEFAYAAKELAYDEALLSAMKNRPEIRELEARENQAKKGIEITKADGRPSIFASWDYYTSSKQTADYSPNPTRGWEDYNIFGITLSWPIFDGWATKARVEQAVIDLKEAQLLKDKTTRDVALDLKTAYLGLKNSIAGIKTAETDLIQYSDQLSVIKERTAKGITSYLDLDDATLQRKTAFFNKNQAIYDYIIAKSNFERATGGS